MQLVTDMNLPLLPVEQPDFDSNPMPYVEEARRHHPWLARSNMGSYLIHGYHAAREIIAKDDKLRPYYDGLVQFYDAENTLWGHFMSEMMNARQGPVHVRLRESAELAFRARNINKYRGLMRSVISELLDEWVPKGKFDFTDFASYYPISVFCGLLGVSPQIAPHIRNALETQAISISMDLKLRPALLAAFDILWEFADSAVKEHEKRAVGGEALIDTMIAAKNAGKLSETELRQNLIMFATAGHDTSKNMFGRIMHLMIQNPHQWERCAEDMAFCCKVVEEALRHSSIAVVFRWVSQDFEYDGVKFPKDAVLFFLFPIAGRDPLAFPDSMEFCPERVHANRHLAFGRGLHVCIGQHLARALLEEGVHVLAQRLRNPRLAGEVTWRRFLGVWGARTLPIEFDSMPRV